MSKAGEQLPAGVRSDMEKSFGADFSMVRVHPSAGVQDTGSATAATHGNNIYFKPGQYSPETTHGKKLLAHELAHVVQQAGGVNKGVNADEKTGAAQKELSSQLAASGKPVPLK